MNSMDRSLARLELAKELNDSRLIQRYSKNKWIKSIGKATLIYCLFYFIFISLVIGIIIGAISDRDKAIDRAKSLPYRLNEMSESRLMNLPRIIEVSNIDKSIESTEYEPDLGKFIAIYAFITVIVSVMSFSFVFAINSDR